MQLSGSRFKWLFAGLAASYLLRVTLKIRSYLQKKDEILAKGLRKRAETKARMQAAVIGLPTIPADTAKTILTSTLTELIALRDSNAVTCAEIVLAFIYQTVESDEIYNFVVEERLREAYDEAVECDREREKGGTRGVLMGIPFSVKDVICVAGHTTTFGCASQSYNVQPSDSVIISLLKQQGAIVLFKSAMGMLGATAETVNRVTGVTKNPWDESRVPGGSSGGDSAALCSRSVPFAIGTDVGGSVRLPAAFCGLYTLKTSVNRISGLGPVPRAGYPYLFTSYGPMAHCISDLSLLLQVLVTPAQTQADPLIPPVPWSPPASRPTLRIGVAKSNSFWPITEANQRVLSSAADALRAEGHEMIDFDLGDMREICEIACGMMFSTAEGGLKLKEEPPLAQHRHVAIVKLTPMWARSIGEWWNKKNLYAVVWKMLGGNEIERFIYLANRILELRKKFYRRMEEQGLEALLVPYALPAFQHDLTPLNHYSCTYTFIFNLFDMPAGSVPIDLVTR